jgi:hypothetical protein
MPPQLQQQQQPNYVNVAAFSNNQPQQRSIGGVAHNPAMMQQQVSHFHPPQSLAQQQQFPNRRTGPSSINPMATSQIIPTSVPMSTIPPTQLSLPTSLDKNSPLFQDLLANELSNMLRIMYAGVDVNDRLTLQDLAQKDPDLYEQLVQQAELNAEDLLQGYIIQLQDNANNGANKFTQNNASYSNSNNLVLNTSNNINLINNHANSNHKFLASSRVAPSSKFQSSVDWLESSYSALSEENIPIQQQGYATSSSAINNMNSKKRPLGGFADGGSNFPVKQAVLNGFQNQDHGNIVHFSSPSGKLSSSMLQGDASYHGQTAASMQSNLSLPQPLPAGNFVTGYINETTVAIDIDRVKTLNSRLSNYSKSYAVIDKELGLPLPFHHICNKLTARLDNYIRDIRVPPRIPPVLMGKSRLMIASNKLSNFCSL